MMLSKVEYEFFDYERPSSEVLELDRQIRLEFFDSPRLYISWTSERHLGADSEVYTVGYGEASYFSEEAACVLDVSESSLWVKHIGNEVELIFLRSMSQELEYQVLEIRSGDNSTYVSSCGLDVVAISEIRPVLHSGSTPRP